MAFPVLLILLIHQGLHQWGVDTGDFSRFMNAIDTEISFVDRAGVIHEGILTQTTSDAVTMAVGSDTKTFDYQDVVSAERLRDRRSDGTAKAPSSASSWDCSPSKPKIHRGCDGRTGSDGPESVPASAGYSMPGKIIARRSINRINR